MYRLVSYSFCLIVAGLVFYAFSPRDGASIDGQKINLSRIQINDVIAVGDNLVAAGERGIIVVSEDNGDTWTVTHRDDEVPVTLTDLSVINDDLLLAVGHDSVILRSTDGGMNWSLIMEDAEMGEPLMGTWSADGKQIFAFGSFGKYMVSTDGGLTFTPSEVPTQGEHMVAMAGNAAKDRMIVGEMGLALHSRDGGESWEQIPPFYNGSLFGVAYLHGDSWVAYGMRGHVFFTSDNGDSWTQVETGSELPLYGHAVSPDGKLMVMVGTAGLMVFVDDQGTFLGTGSVNGLGTLTSAVVLPDDEIYVSGQRGLAKSSRGLVAAQK